MSGAERSQSPEDTRESRSVSNDLPCNSCGYNLRGLPSGGRCPECGTEVARSLRGDLLSVAEPAWLERLDRGLLYVTIGYIGVLVSAIALPTISGLARLGLERGLGISIPDVVFSAPVLIGTAASLIFVLVGVVDLTTLDPRLSLTEQPVALRRIVRGAAVAALLMAVLYYSRKLAGTAGRGVAPTVTGVSGWTFLFALAFTLVAASLYLARLCERIPNLVLAKQIRLAARGFAVCLVLTAAAEALDYLSGMLKASWAATLVGVLAALLWLSVIACFLYAVSLMHRWLEHREAVKHCLLEARGNREVPSTPSGPPSPSPGRSQPPSE